MTLKRQLLTVGAVGVFSLGSLNALAKKEYPKIYPFVPTDTSYIHERVEFMSEDQNYVKNFYSIVDKGYSKGKTFKVQQGQKKTSQPWGSTFWPLNRGLIADAYSDSALGAYNPFRFFSWEHNRDRYLSRANKVHKKVDELDNDELAKLAPSEKYDILLGDKSFGLTNKIWAYMQSWGSMKEYGHLHSLDKVGGKSMQNAETFLNWGWYDSISEAKENAVKLTGGLAEHFANKMVKNGEYSSVEDALPEATSIAQTEQHDFVLKKKNDYMATWEGICHGWSTASGIVPRPRKSVTFKLKDGRKLKFYPEDIKGLVSYLWANSLIQDGRYKDEKTGEIKGGGILMQGLRCNEKSPKKDEWGRYYDSKPDFFSGKHEPRCVGVHPAIWHLGLTNIIGKQGRSFIVERKVKAAVDNHPMYKYKMEYFNPYTGKYSDNLKEVVMPQVDKHDQFKDFRNADTKYIVGVKAEMTYLDWERPKRKETNSEDDDSEVDKVMLYDLELDAKGVIIGGQWRTKEVGKPDRRRRHGSATQRREKLRRTQPDFFWVVTKTWKNWFNEVTDVEPWSDTTGQPPASWLQRAQGAHNFVYYKTFNYGFTEKCEIINEKTKEVVKVPCEYQESKPQPFINVVNKLVELSQ